MKSAIVLGLALATSAMAADEELFVAHTGKFEHDLVQKFHGKIMFDEVADDEFARRPKGDNNRDKEVLSRIGYTNPFFAADDELAVRNPTPEQYQRLQQNKNLVYKYADDEFAKRPKGDNNRDKEVLSRIGYTNPFFAADDELLIMLKPRSAFKTEEEYQKYYARVRYTLDDAADDELGLKFVHLPVGEHAAFDDDELAARRPKGDNNRDKEVLSRIGYTNPFFAADDEFAAKRPKGDNNRDKEVLSRIGYTNPFFAADDELLVTSLVDRTRFGFDEHGRILRDNIGRPVKPVLARDDEGDDELLYLGQLITERAFIPRMYDDDELRAEKPSHVKAEERAQMKGELPKKQKKLRPRPDVIPMAEN